MDDVSIRYDARDAGSDSLPADASAIVSAPAMVPIWDVQVRIFHWSLVGLFIVAYLSADKFDRLHLIAGYSIVGLLALRLVSGFIGSPHARFSDFVRSPGEVLAYLKLIRERRSPRYPGHNPAGGAMVIALMAMIGAICVTGHLMTTTAWWGSETMENAHEVLVNLTLGLIGLHLLGNFASSLLHHENLTMSMINGLKRRQ